MRFARVAVFASAALACAGCSSGDTHRAATGPSTRTVKPATASALALRPVHAPADPDRVDPRALLPAAPGVGLGHVWHVPPGTGAPQIVVGWHFRSRRKIAAWPDPRRYVLTVWNRVGVTSGSATWVPHALIRASPFPLTKRSVRIADVTGDGHADLLVTVACSDCNHGTEVVAVYASFGTAVRRIYGGGWYLDVSKGAKPDAGVRGREVDETWWGARHGLLWFDEPRGGSSVCCPALRLQTFMRWTRRGWRTVSARRVQPARDQLIKSAPT